MATGRPFFVITTGVRYFLTSSITRRQWVLKAPAGIVFMVFCASFAGAASYSVVRNLKITAGLIAVAFAFQKLLGFNLPLY